jgi:hypothetical protein
MKKYEVHTLTSKASFKSKKEELSKEVEQFLNRKANEGYEVVSVNFTYYHTSELVAFITLYR